MYIPKYDSDDDAAKEYTHYFECPMSVLSRHRMVGVRLSTSFYIIIPQKFWGDLNLTKSIYAPDDDLRVKRREFKCGWTTRFVHKIVDDGDD